MQILHLRSAMADVPAFEFALRDRAARLASFRSASYLRVHRVDRLPESPGLALVSEHVEGIRLSDLLRIAHERNVDVDISTALWITRQVLQSAAALHHHASDVANGLLAPERLIITPRARIVVAEQTLCAAIEQLRYPAEHLWRELRIAVPSASNSVRFTHRTDVLNIGLVTLALTLGRPLADDDFPARVAQLVDSACERSALGYQRPLSPPLRDWLSCALQLESDRSFASIPEAWLAFEKVIAADPLYISSPIAVEMFLYSCTAALVQPIGAPERPRQQAPSTPPAREHAERPAPAEPAPSTPTSVLTDHEIQAVMEPAPSSGTSQRPAGSEGDGIDWTAISQQPAAVATPGEITQLFSDAEAPSFEERPAETPQKPGIAAVVAPVLDSGGVSSDSITGDVSLPELDEIDEAVAGERVWRFSQSPGWRRLAIAAALAAIIGAGALVTRSLRPEIVSASEMGTVLVETSPAGLQIFVDGVERGATPARLSLSTGEHVLEVRGQGTSRRIPIQVAGGTELSQYLEFAAAPQTGELRVESELAGATVIIDGRPRGTAPLTIGDLQAGALDVLLQTPAGSTRHSVTIQPGATTSLKVPASATTDKATPEWGWLSVTSPTPAEIRVGGTVVGSTETGRLRMAPGRHELEIVNTAQGYRVRRVAYVEAGKITRLNLNPAATGMVNLNATPWAEVWIGGRRIGETPLANVSVPVGTHEVVFRHPQLGEKRQGVSVTAGVPVRLSVAMQ